MIQTTACFRCSFFILSLPFVFLLTKILFNSPLAGWVAVSLYAVSPFIHSEAQEARYYILWVFFFILSNYLFLLAIKHDKSVWWIGYSVTSVFGIVHFHVISFIYFRSSTVYTSVRKRVADSIYHFTIVYCFSLPALGVFSVYRSPDDRKRLAWQKSFHTSFFSLDLLFLQLLGFVRSFAFLFDAKLYLFWFNGTSTSEIYSALLIDLVCSPLLSTRFFTCAPKLLKK
jgi:hypothetical protein